MKQTPCKKSTAPRHFGLWSTLTVFVVSTLFFALAYPHHLHSQEQYQLFLFDAPYALDVIALPGGLADWLGRFCTQFFIYAWVGAVIIGLLLAAVHWFTLRLLGRSGLTLLSALPTALLGAYLMNENALLGAAWAVLIVLAVGAWLVSDQAGFGILCDKKERVIDGRCLGRGEPMSERWIKVGRVVMLVVSIQLLYWMAGPVTVLLPLLLLAAGEGRRAAWVEAGILTVMGILLAVVLCMPRAFHLYLPVLTDRLFYGVHYFRHPQIVPTQLWLAVGAIALMALLNGLLHLEQRWPLQGRWSTLAMCALNLLLLGGVGYISYNPQTERVMAYDFMARNQQWNRLLEEGKKSSPANQISTTAFNLAMAMKGQLVDHMFEYKQNGTEGLLPVFVREPVGPLTTAEAYYQLGMINTAQRFVFEAQEAIPDFQKSGRCYRRLAETNLINGAYDVARKYLLTLTKTWFYADWARETLQLIDNPERIDQHKEYGRLRQCNIQAEFFYSDRELSQMLGQLFLSNRGNRLAFEYLQASFLLKCDLESFVRCFDLGSQLGYPAVPKHFQEAFLLWWSKEHSPNEKTPIPIRPDLLQSLNQCFVDMRQPGATIDSLEPRFGRTYWYYYFLNNQH